jgi:rRNA-processing protein FCF1
MTLEEQLFARHGGKSVLLDSNLLLVFLSGLLGTHLFQGFKRISNYTVNDYELLVRLIASFAVLLTTPHVLTEVSNLANALREPYKRDWYINLATLITSDQERFGIREQWVPVTELAGMPEFVAFGITDAALTRLSSEALVITEDYRLSDVLNGQGTPVLNFRDLRKMQLFAND